MPKYFSAVVLTVLSAMLVCGMGGCRLRTEYSIGVINLTDATISDLTIQFGRYRTTMGLLDPDCWATDQLVPGGLPEQATVRWTDSAGKGHTQSVTVRAALKSKSSCTVYFLIGRDNAVTVEAAEFDDPYARTRILKQHGVNRPPVQ